MSTTTVNPTSSITRTDLFESLIQAAKAQLDKVSATIHQRRRVDSDAVTSERADIEQNGIPNYGANLLGWENEAGALKNFLPWLQRQKDCAPVNGDAGGQVIQTSEGYILLVPGAVPEGDIAAIPKEDLCDALERELSVKVELVNTECPVGCALLKHQPGEPTFVFEVDGFRTEYQIYGYLS